MNDRLYGLGYLRLSDALRVEACNAGLFVSPAQGIHHGRVIDSYELILVRTGTLVLSEETTVFALEQGDTLILWPGRFHRGVAPYAPNTSFYWVHFFLRADAPDTAVEGSVIPQHCRLPEPLRLTELFLRFLDDQERNRLEKYLDTLPYPHFEPTPNKPVFLIRMEKSGKRTIGRFANRRFRVGAPNIP